MKSSARRSSSNSNWHGNKFNYTDTVERLLSLMISLFCFQQKCWITNKIFQDCISDDFYIFMSDASLHQLAPSKVVKCSVRVSLHLTSAADHMLLYQHNTFIVYSIIILSSHHYWSFNFSCIIFPRIWRLGIKDAPQL